MREKPSLILSKLNNSTYLIIQNDKYLEFPYIYVKFYSKLSLAVVIDTGCGGHNRRDRTTSEQLKQFIETHIFKQTEHVDQRYLVICTHCHFDHIGGIEAFARAGARIFASGYDRDFLAPERRSANSLCWAFDTKTPKYEIDIYAKDGERLEHEGVDLGLRILHTPGHTPDSLAVYDQSERWLFVGDTCYKRVAEMPWGERQDVPIVLPLQGNWTDFVCSLKKLVRFLEDEDSNMTEQCAKLGAGHTTANAFASETVNSALAFAERIAKGEVPVVAEIPGNKVAPGGSLGDEIFVFWQDEGEPEFSLMAPKRFEKDFDVVQFDHHHH